MFRVGQKVVCVNDAPWRPGYRPFDRDEGIVKGQIYTVRRRLIDADGDEILHLDEVARNAQSRRVFGPLAGYWAKRFRPVVERKTDISIFTAMLNPNRIKERA